MTDQREQEIVLITWPELQKEYTEWEQAERANGKLWADIPNITDWTMQKLSSALNALAEKDAEMARVTTELILLRSDAYEQLDLVTGNNFAEMQKRAEAAESELEQVKEAVVIACDSGKFGNPKAAAAKIIQYVAARAALESRKEGQ